MKKLKRFSIFILISLLLFTLLFPACGTDNHDSGSDTGNSNTATDSPNDSYTPYQPTHDDFAEDLVIVLIKPEYSEVNKPWYAEDFQLKGIGIEKIVDTRYQENPSDYSASPNFKQRLKLFLSEPSKENVIAAIHQIEVLYFVEWAIPEYHYDIEDDYTPNDEQKVAARRCNLEQFLLKEHSEATIEDVSFFNYIGTYGNCLVAVFYGGKWHTWNGDCPDIAINFTINNLTFEYPMGYPILVYCDQQIYTLQEAYGSELISAETLAQIHTDYYNP